MYKFSLLNNIKFRLFDKVSSSLLTLKWESNHPVYSCGHHVKSEVAWSQVILGKDFVL